jgi:2',3'-cyclic-nucleotide 2'-phosphodiesterase (5'-nucleotidase family)
MESNNNRRNFLKSVGTLSLGAAIISPLSTRKYRSNRGLDIENEIDQNKPQTISILQTTDVHCQIHPHDELFWENGKAVLENWWVCMATLLKELKRKSQYLYNRYR